MDSKIAGAIGLLAPATLVGMWVIYLFSVRPDCADSIQLAMDSAKYALTPSESGTWLFIYTLTSITVGLVTSFILFFSANKQVAMYITAAHSIAALFLYTWSLVLVIALPLFFFDKVRKNT
ncbi:hypothetical protein [Microbulbifer sp. GL-2]|uniref:hypothetical protein n=1 Tax=Microbulbifer sp. GL-2 TaxID=2591606 RepID=UPI001162B210|nr:hypothetical protein [Microbulbifer sp. GL-2]BBM00225.1 hypothetical protein GL2_02990 [Microbulbifer sp. GL-2]